MVGILIFGDFLTPFIPYDLVLMFITNFLNSTDPIITKIRSFVALVTRGDAATPAKMGRRDCSPGVGGAIAIGYVMMRRKR